MFLSKTCFITYKITCVISNYVVYLYINLKHTIMKKVEYLPMGEVAYHLENGLTVYYYNEDTPLLFKQGLREVGRLLLLNVPCMDTIRFADQAPAENVIAYFS